MTGDERSVAQGSTLAPCLPSWRRPPPGWLIASSRACRCATGCCRSRSHCAASLRCTLNCSPRYYRPFTGSLRRIGSGRRAANAVKWPPAPSPSSSASARRPIIAAIEEPALIERLLMQAWRCVRFRELGQAASGRVRESGAVGSRHSIGLRCPMATASIELALWKPPRHAHAAGYVCTTLRAVIGVTISLAPG